MPEIKQTFLTANIPNTYQRTDPTHPLDLYLGIDSMARWSLLLIGNTSHAPHITSCSALITEARIRPDQRWIITISLADDKFRDLFLIFCKDIIDSSRHLKSQDTALHFVISRYNKWRAMFSGTQSSLLTPIQAKGLLGEMYFLKTYLIPEYGNPEAALSWTGPRFLPQDFIINDTWYEIKTISSNQPAVHISSIEQLDCRSPGFLVIVHADRTSTTSLNALNLNILYRDLMSSLQSDIDKANFSNMLLQYGYVPREEYESSEYVFTIKDIERYQVDKDFPCLRRTQLPDNIISAEYNISLTSIKNYKKD